MIELKYVKWEKMQDDTDEETRDFPQLFIYSIPFPHPSGMYEREEALEVQFHPAPLFCASLNLTLCPWIWSVFGV